MEDPVVARAHQFAIAHHNDIWRKYIVPPEPYIRHPERVEARFASLNLGEPDKSNGRAACFTHDTLEDPTKDGHFVTFDELALATNVPVAHLVQELTNPSKGSSLDRESRKAMDRAHIARISDIAKLIKLIDRTDNLNSMGKAPESFRRLYLGESELLLAAIGTVNYPDYLVLRDEYIAALRSVRSSLPLS